MSEWDWNKTIAHLKYEESEVIKILNDPQYNVGEESQLSNVHIKALKAINRDARQGIYRHLGKKRHYLIEKLAEIEAIEQDMIDTVRFSTARLGLLLKEIQEAIEIAEKAKAGKTTYRVYHFAVSQEYINSGTITLNTVSMRGQRSFDTKEEALRVAAGFIEKGSKSNYVELMAVTDRGAIWFEGLVKACNLRGELAASLRRSSEFDLSAKFDMFIEKIKGIVSKTLIVSPEFNVEFKSGNPKHGCRYVLVEYFQKE